MQQFKTNVRRQKNLPQFPIQDSSLSQSEPLKATPVGGQPQANILKTHHNNHRIS